MLGANATAAVHETMIRKRASGPSVRREIISIIIEISLDAPAIFQ
jgi:hypothetical protein